MNNALRISVSDLRTSLQKALLNSELDQKIGQRAKEVGVAIANANMESYPEIQATSVKTGSLSWAISFTAPGLWEGVFGNRHQAGRGFISSAKLSQSSRLRGSV